MSRARGYVLLPVAFALGLVAALAYLMSREGAIGVEMVAAEVRATRARYVAVAGLEHTNWRVQNSACSGYASLPATAFGSHSYSASVTPASGSPVSITATGTLAGGFSRTVTRGGITVYQPRATVIMQPGAGTGVDAWVSANPGKVNRNYGASATLDIEGGANVSQALLRFDLSALPANARVLSAKLELNLESMTPAGASAEVTAYRMTEPWLEGSGDGAATGDGATWSSSGSVAWSWPANHAVADPQATASVDAGTLGWYTWHLTRLADGWQRGLYPNHGLLLAGSAGSYRATFTSSDGATAGNRPRLTVTYACECGADCGAPIAQTVLLVVPDAASPSAQDSARQALIESFGFAVVRISASDPPVDFAAAVAGADVAYISEEVAAPQLGTKLTGARIGVVNEEGALNDELGLAAGHSALSAGVLDVTDNGHYITQPFAAGPVTLFASTQPVDTVSGTLAPGLQVLAEWGGAGALVLTDIGAPLQGGGYAAGRRVKLPWGGDAFDIGALTGDGRVLMQRALEWAATRPPAVLLVVPDAAALGAQDAARKALIEGWGFAVAPISAADAQADFDAALARSDAAYVSEEVSPADLGTKLTAAPTGVVNEEGFLNDELGVASSRKLVTTTTLTVTDNGHFITQPFATGPLTLFDSSEPGSAVFGTPAPGLQRLGTLGGNDALVVLDTGAALYGGGSAAGRRVNLPWAGAGFDIGALTADGRLLMRRAVEWAAGTVMLDAVADNYLIEDETSNKGNSNRLKVGPDGGGSDGRPLLRFDLTSLPPGAQIVSATLRLLATDRNGSDAYAIGAHRVTEAWSETGSSWFDADAATPWSGGPGGSYDPLPAATQPALAAGWYAWDVGALVQDWLDGVSANHGIALVSTSVAPGNDLQLDSREGVDAPRLVIVYTTN